jgi:hypothetical protein
VIQMHVFVQQQTLLCQEVYGLQHRSLCCIFTVCLQEPVHFLGVSIYMGFCAAPGVSVYKSFVLHLDVSAYKSFVLHLDVSVYKSFVTHLDVSAYKSTENAKTVGVRLEKFFWFVSVCFETDMFISDVSIHDRNTETNRKSYFLVP